MRFSTAVAALSAAAAVSATSYGNGTDFTTTEVVTKYTTFCPGPTTVVQNSKTYTVTAATTLTIEDCPCTVTKTYASVPAGKPTTTGDSKPTGSKPHDSKPTGTGTGSSGSGSHHSGVAGPSGTGSSGSGSGSGSGHHGSYPSGAAGPSGTGSGSSPSESGIYGNGTKTSSGSGSGSSATSPAKPSDNLDSGASRSTLAGGALAGLLAGVAYML